MTKLVQQVVNMSFSRPFNIFAILFIIIIISINIKDKRDNNKISFISKDTIKALEIAGIKKVNKQEQLQILNNDINNIVKLNDIIQIKLITFKENNENNIISTKETNIKITKDGPFSKFLLDKKVGDEVNIPFDNVNTDKNIKLQSTSTQDKMVYKITILSIKNDNN